MYQFWSYDPSSRKYRGTFDTARHLPPGFYAVRLSSYGEPMAEVLDPREDNILTFSAGPMTQVLTEIAQFWKSANHYKRLGVTHKRGILLHGPHGCGKSSIVNHIIRDTTTREGVVLEVDNLYDFRAAMPLFRQIENGRPVVAILEDLEQFVESDEEELLELLDGASTLGDGLLFLATTNKLNKIPTRIRCRPSRVDTLIEIGLPSSEQRLEYLRFLLERGLDMPRLSLDEWVQRTARFSLAQVKELVISVVVYCRDFEASVARIKEMCETTEED